MRSEVARLRGSPWSTRGFDRLLRAASAIRRCSSRSRERSWPRTGRGSGECRLNWASTFTAVAMILRSNLPLLRKSAANARVLDIGGWYQPFNLATHVIDLCPYVTRRCHEAVDPEDVERFAADTWVVADVCAPPWPYPDKFFDFVLCSHLLEDVRDPIAVCREINRVGKAGYIETPSRLREIFSKDRLFSLLLLRGSMPEVGFYHHRWFVEAAGTHLKLPRRRPPCCKIAANT